MKPIVFFFPDSQSIRDVIINKIGAEDGRLIYRQFPDSESYVRITKEVEDRECIIVCTLNDPGNKILPLVFTCKLLRQMRARSICLVAPYLSYMRQDAEFNSGEAVTSRYFAELLSAVCDSLVTVDPHLHRIKALSDLYTIPCRVVHSGKLIASWIKQHINSPLIIGPDEESEQWVSSVAEAHGIPSLVLRKKRLGDVTVDINALGLLSYKGYTPVIVDDIISSGGTMRDIVHKCLEAGLEHPVCIGIHAVFSDGSHGELFAAGAADIVTTNTIPHQSNKINVGELLAGAISDLLSPAAD